MSNVCPKCKSADQIKKLSAIINEGTRTTSGNSTTSRVTDINGNQEYYSKDAGRVGSSVVSGKANSNSTTVVNLVEQSNLARQLSFPRPPEEPVLKRAGFCGLYFIFFVVWLVLTNFAYGPVDFLIARAVNHSVPIGIACTGMISAIIMAPLIIFVHNLLLKPQNEKLKKKYDIEVGNYRVAFNDWKRASIKWDHMYYCFRDDIVFVPGERDYAPVTEVIEFCYSKEIFNKD